MDYNFSTFYSTLSQLDKINSDKVFQATNPGFIAASQHIDSITKLVQSSSIAKVALNTLSIGFPDPSHNALIASSGLSVFSSLTEALKLSAPVMIGEGKTVLEMLNASEDLPEDDFVTLDEISIKEWKVPDTIAIPIGNNRISMKTELFIALIGIIVPIFFGFAGLIVDLNAAASEAQTETQRIEIEEKRNELIQESNQLFSRYLDIVGSIDESHSSKADQIESCKESLLKYDSSPSDSDSRDSK